jgi:hypothetical protein
MSRLSAFIERHHGWFACAVFVVGCVYIIADAFSCA